MSSNATCKVAADAVHNACGRPLLRSCGLYRRWMSATVCSGLEYGFLAIRHESMSLSGCDHRNRFSIGTRADSSESTAKWTSASTVLHIYSNGTLIILHYGVPRWEQVVIQDEGSR